MSFVQKYELQGSSGGNNFVSKIIKEKAMVYSLTMTFPNKGDQTAWYIFEVEKAKREAFEKVFQNNEAFEFSDYGTVHAFGWGDEPPPEIKTEMRERFGLFE